MNFNAVHHHKEAQDDAESTTYHEYAAAPVFERNTVADCSCHWAHEDTDRLSFAAIYDRMEENDFKLFDDVDVGAIKQYIMDCL